MHSELPIAGFREEIVAAVRENAVTVITAETGAGKSTQVPQYLLEDGHDMVVTQPRRLAARTVACRVAEERGEEIGGIVGYRTAVDQRVSEATRCLFCTDGLALVRELMGQNKGVLLLDEVHEWNENMEVLVAWARLQVERGSNFKVVLMSATLEAEKLANFFGGAPVISVPGRLFSVAERQASGRIVDDVEKLVREGRNVLVFQPGKAEISETCSYLEQMKVSAEVLPLHGQLSPEEQAMCFRHYGRPKVVVSTNVAQTSVTIDDIDAVVDAGTERRIELVNSVEGLYLRPISQADSKQRKGRAGRTKDGIYIDHCAEQWENRLEFPQAEILRKRLDQTVLRLAIAGFDMEALSFFHQPKRDEIHAARESLVKLGCMSNDGSVTKIGRLVNRFPVSVQYARMLVEAERLNVVDDVLTVAAILEVDGICVPPPSRNRPERPDWRRMVRGETESDILALLSVWQQAGRMGKKEMKDSGIAVRKYYRAKEIRRSLVNAMKRFFSHEEHDEGSVSFGSTGSRTDILKAVCAGMVDHLYRGQWGSYKNGDAVTREIGTASCVRGAEWIVGKPFDLEIRDRYGDMFTLNLIQHVSVVEPEWLADIAPHLVEHQSGLNPTYSRLDDCVISTTQKSFNGHVLKSIQVRSPNHPEGSRVFAEWLAYAHPSEVGCADVAAILRHNESVVARAKELNERVGHVEFPLDMSSHYRRALAGAASLRGVVDVEALRLKPLDAGTVARIEKENPAQITICGEVCEVTYPLHGEPRVTVSGDMVSSGRWKKIPDAGLALPSGKRQLLLQARLGLRYASSVSGAEFKEQIRLYLNERLFDEAKRRGAYQSLGEAKVDTPEFKVPLKEYVYGQDVLTGEDLVAYQTFRMIRATWFEKLQIREEHFLDRSTACRYQQEVQEYVYENQKKVALLAKCQDMASSFENDGFRRRLGLIDSDLLRMIDRYVYDLAHTTRVDALEMWFERVDALRVRAEDLLKREDVSTSDEEEAELDLSKLFGGAVTITRRK